ncbi:hypothetical protein GCM10007377_12260 [Galliscardovia ingluviei]|uniref:HipA-like C-terminal domain-containing protein n=1 Tax=Galliscardovia ingluviei TaxID=1769422 RepID=A0A8J3F2P2_9BIFI|nr:HipA domain-containing protein [Galliscardovia ingluviei]GGI14706.1 hypothetical protein GCM10007377_12260 [Galliscardovia ingluviei]
MMLEILHDFSMFPLRVSRYDGAAGKQTMYIGDQRYMVKFGYTVDEQQQRSSRTSYANIPVNEFLGSRIFQASGIPTQEVMLGTYGEHSVAACRDFMQQYPSSYQLLHFKQLEISMPGESSLSKARPDWEFVRHVMTDSPYLSTLRSQVFDRYYKMVCVDALIGNYDRHSNNWGFIADSDTNIVALAPVYDCGSCLAPHLSEDAMRDRLADPRLMRQANMDAPYMSMNVRNKRRKFNYFLLSDEGKPFRAQLINLHDCLTPQVLDEIVMSVPGISDIRRDFYRTTLHTRREVVWKPAFELALQEREHTLKQSEPLRSPTRRHKKHIR